VDKQFLAYAIAYLTIVLPAVATIDNFLNWESKHGILAPARVYGALAFEVQRSVLFSLVVVALLVLASFLLSRAMNISFFEALILVLMTLAFQVEDLYYVLVRAELTPLHVEWKHLATYWAMGHWTTISVYQVSVTGIAAILVVAAEMDRIRSVLKEELDLY